MTSFRKLCETIQEIRETRGSNAKIALCSALFANIENDCELNLAAQFIGEGAFSNISGRKASVGSRTAGLAAAAFCEIDYDLVFKPSRTATGSNSETIARLMENIPEAAEKRTPVDFSLAEMETWFEKLESVSSRDEKQKLLHQMWEQMSPVEIKYSIRMLGQGSLRIGFEIRSVVAAIASAFGAEKEQVRYAHMITGSIGKTAVLARNGRLGEASFNLFHPLSFMLASPIESRSVSDITGYVAEEKFDGMRAQVHADGEKVKIFSRDLNDITSSFPDVTSIISKKKMKETVFDGEICVYRDEMIMPFQLLQKRMGVKKPGKKLLSEFPALFVAFDLLCMHGEPVFGESLLKRRKRLEDLAGKFSIPLTTQRELTSEDEIEKLFEQALAHGNEGLMLKRKESSYEYGQRGKSWLKVKKPGGTLDTVIMYAHAGSGKRGGLYSDFTLGISVKNDERYEEEFIPIGKAYGGYTDDELKRLNREVKEAAVERYGPTLGLIPRIVVEIEFDDIQVNKRTKAGYTMRLPRFRAIRWDLAPSDVNTLRDVEKMFQEKLNRQIVKQGANTSFHFF
jgi:DNA ligase 1